MEIKRVRLIFIVAFVLCSLLTGRLFAAYKLQQPNWCVVDCGLEDTIGTGDYADGLDFGDQRGYRADCSIGPLGYVNWQPASPTGTIVESGFYHVGSTFDSTPPTGTILINGGDVYANSTSVILTLSASDGSGTGVSKMRFSNDGTSWSSEENYNTVKSWTLTSGGGTKTVYVQYRDYAYNWSNPISDTIILDTAAPQISNLAVSPLVARAGVSLTITFTVSEALQGNPTVTVAVNGATLSSQSGNNYTYTYTVQGTEGEGSKVVNVSVTDLVGKTGSASTIVTFDFTPPTGSISISAGHQYTNSTLVILTFSASDGSGTGVSKMRFSNDGTSWSSEENYTTFKSWTLTRGGDNNCKASYNSWQASANF